MLATSDQLRLSYGKKMVFSYSKVEIGSVATFVYVWLRPVAYTVNEGEPPVLTINHDMTLLKEFANFHISVVAQTSGQWSEREFAAYRCARLGSRP